MRRSSALSGFVLACLFGVHALALNVYPVHWFGDDLAYIRFAAENRDATAFQILGYQDHSLERYRPLTKLLALRSYKSAGLDPALPRLAATITLGLTVLLALALARALEIDGRAAQLGMMLFLIHQLPISVLYRNARMEHHFTLCGLAAIYALDRGLRASARAPARFAALALVPLLLMAALLWSEAALCFPLLVAFWAIFRSEGDSWHRRRTVIAALVAAASVAAGYLAWYRFVGAPLQGAERYAFGVGPNVLANVATAVAGWATPVSSVWVIGWLREPQRNVAGLLLAAASSVSVLGWLGSGWREARRAGAGQDKTAFVLLASAAICLWPVVLLQHLSELYVYPSLLFFCLAAGILAHQRLRAYRRKPSWGGVAIAILLLAAAGGHVQASVQKVMLLHRNGERFERLVRELEEKAGARERGVIDLVNAAPERRPISQFVLPMRLVYLTGPQRGYRVEWFTSAELHRHRDGAWIVREDGSIVATGD